MSYRFWTPEEDNLLKARFPFEPTETLATALGRGPSAVSRHAYSLGLAKEKGRSQGKPAPHNLDVTALLNPGHDAAYFFGMALADGVIAGNTFRLRNKNLGVLLAARRILNSSHPIKMSRTSTSMCLAIHDSQLAAIMRTWGVSRNIWPAPPAALLGSYLRGYFDGDGYADYAHVRGLRVRFTGKGAILPGLTSQLQPLIGTYASTDAGRVWYHGGAAQRIGQLMYAHDGFFLARKRQPFLDYEARI